MLSAYCVLFYCSLHLPCSSPLLCRFGSAHRAGLSAVSHENCPASSTFAALFVDPAWNLSACHFPCSFFSLSLFTILAHSCHTSSYGTKLFFCLLYALCLTPCIPALLPSSFIHSFIRAFYTCYCRGLLIMIGIFISFCSTDFPACVGV